MLALSATVIRNGYGKPAVRCACSRRTQDSRSASSLCTGTTMSSAGTGAGGAAGRGAAVGAVAAVVMAPTISSPAVAVR